MSRTRGAWNTRGTWIAGIVLAAVLALTAYSLLAGSDSDSVAADAAGKGSAAPSVSGSASPEPQYTRPADWTEPERWTALPRGQRMDERGSQIGFPHTVEGAASMMAAANSTTVEGERSNVDEQLRIYHSYMGPAEQTAENAVKIETHGRQTDKDLAEQLGVQAGQPLPSGAYLRTHVVGYKVIKKSDDEVSVWLLTRGVTKAGETKKEEGTYARSLAAAQWQGGDWKLTADATRRALKDIEGQPQPPIVAPGDAAFNQGGWTAIRAAS